MPKQLAAIATLLPIAFTALPSLAAEIGKAAPACELAALGSSSVLHTKQFAGKVVVIDFWASWCPPCLKAFPTLNGLDHDYRDRGLQIVGVNVDEDINDARAFLSQHAASFAVGADPQGSCPRAFGVKGMPSTYLLDRKGVVRLIHVGFRSGDTDELRHQIEALLAENANQTADAESTGVPEMRHRR